MTASPVPTRALQATTLPADRVRNLLSLRDLTDPAAGPHALQVAVDRVEAAVAAATGVSVHRHRPNPVVAVADNYDRLGYPPDAAARDARYSRYLTADLMLRAHTSAAMPLLHERIAAGELYAGEHDLVLSVPGLTYRRDVVDRQHVGEPHQLDVWRLRRGGTALTVDDLEAQVATVVEAVLPGRGVADRTARCTRTRSTDARSTSRPATAAGSRSASAVAPTPQSCAVPGSTRRRRPGWRWASAWIGW